MLTLLTLLLNSVNIYLFLLLIIYNLFFHQYILYTEQNLFSIYFKLNKIFLYILLCLFVSSLCTSLIMFRSGVCSDILHNLESRRMSQRFFTSIRYTKGETKITK